MEVSNTEWEILRYLFLSTTRSQLRIWSEPSLKFCHIDFIWVILCKRRLCYNRGSWRVCRTFIPIQSRLIVGLSGDSVTITARGGFVPTKSRLIVGLPHLYRGRSLWLVRLRVLFIATWLLQVGSLPDTTAARRFCATSISADCLTASQAACSLCANMASSCRQRGLLREIIRTHMSSLIVSRHQLVHSSIRSLYRSHNQLFPLPPSLYVYRQPYFTLDRAFLMYATGRPSNVHFLSARGSLSSTEDRGIRGLENCSGLLCPPNNLLPSILLPICMWRLRIESSRANMSTPAKSATVSKVDIMTNAKICFIKLKKNSTVLREITLFAVVLRDKKYKALLSLYADGVGARSEFFQR